MSRRLNRSTVRPLSEMNLTSMMDLTFLLLITFIITFPLIEQGIPLKLPAGKAQDLGSQAKSAVVSVDQEGRIFWGEEAVTPETLEFRLVEQMREKPDTHLLVRGDEAVAYGHIVGVLKIAHRLGISRLALVTREE